MLGVERGGKGGRGETGEKKKSRSNHMEDSRKKGKESSEGFKLKATVLPSSRKRNYISGELS